MRHIFIFLLSLVLFACADKHHDPSPTHKDISGHWYGQTSTLTVDFVIAKVPPYTAFRVTSGTIRIKDTSYPITIQEEEETLINQLWLHNTDGWVKIIYAASSDFKTLLSSNEIYYQSGTDDVLVIHEQLTLIRK